MGVESKASRRARALEILAGLRRAYPDAACALRHSNPLELLVATILSAQCTDARVNLVTPELFRRYPTAGDYAGARRTELERQIYSTGFFRNKARSIMRAASMIAGEYGGRVPQTMEDLIRLPGVARKTANVILGTAFGKAEGVVVDTHVNRLSHRMRLSLHKDPNKVEKDLMELIPRDAWTDFSHMMIHHGRQICAARKPLCPDCPVRRHCPSAEKLAPKA